MSRRSSRLSNADDVPIVSTLVGRPLAEVPQDVSSKDRSHPGTPQEGSIPKRLSRLGAQEGSIPKNPLHPGTPREGSIPKRLSQLGSQEGSIPRNPLHPGTPREGSIPKRLSQLGAREGSISRNLSQSVAGEDIVLRELSQPYECVEGRGVIVRTEEILRYDENGNPYKLLRKTIKRKKSKKCRNLDPSIAQQASEGMLTQILQQPFKMTTIILKPWKHIAHKLCSLRLHPPKY